MNNATDRLQSLKVLDAMAKDVVQVAADQTMAEIAAAFVRRGISAAPVVDAQGRCVGVLSAADFVKRELAGKRERGSQGGGESGTPPAHSAAEDLARAHMTSPVQSIAPDSPLLQAARKMSAQHVHRLVVLDPQDRPLGVISTMDIVAALLNAIDEMKLRR